MGQLNLGSTQILSNGTTLEIPSNINLGGNWINAPSGTVITSAYGYLSSAFSTTGDGDSETGLFVQLVRKLAGGTSSGTSTIHVSITGGCQYSNSNGTMGGTSIYRKVNGGTASFQAYVDAGWSSVNTPYRPHSGQHIDSSPIAAGSTLRFDARARSRGSGGGNRYDFHTIVGGVSNHVTMTAYEIVN